MQRFLLILMLAVLCLIAKSQHLSGYVIDSITGEPLIGAHVICGNNTTITNNYGYFSINQNKSDTIKISYVGYLPLYLFKTTAQKDILKVTLSPSTHIEEVSVSGKVSIQDNSEMGVINLPIQQIKNLPSLAGESDVMKTLQLLPGVKPMGEGHSSFMVRGGSPDQNLIVLDNIPLYYVNHLGGFVSVFNTHALSNVKMYKGIFPPKYGGRLSSVVNIDTKNGNLSERHSSLTLGLITTNLLLEGPIKKDTLSYFISARRFMYDLISRPVTYLFDDKKQSGYTFYDLNTKINYMPNAKNRLFFSLYSGYDNILSSKKDKEDNSSMKNKQKWGNTAVSFRWNHLYGSKLFSNITLYGMQYKYNTNFEYTYKEENSSTTSEFQSLISDYGLSLNYEYYPASKLKFEFGSNQILHDYKPNHYYQTNSLSNTAISDSSIYNPDKTTLENALFIETTISPLKYISFNLGYRFSLFLVDSNNYISHEPRFVANINVFNFFTIKSGYSEMSQYVHLLTYFGTSMPADLWVPSTTDIPPEHSKIYSFGIYRSFKEYGFEMSIEGYYKELSNLIDFKSGYNIMSSTDNWAYAVEKSGTGTSKGVEFLVQKNSGRLSGWVAYTLSRTTRQFENINHGKPYVYTYDATHDISIVTSYKLKKNLTLSTTWTYKTGRAITLPNEKYSIALIPFYNEAYENQSTPIIVYDHMAGTYDSKNNIRMTPYHRLDISLNHTKHKKRSERVISFNIYNAYNKQNAIYYYLGTKEELDNMGRSTGNFTRVVYQVS